MDSKTPLTFKLPDGDTATLPTWDYIIDKLNTNLTPILDNMDLITADLTVINNKLATLIEN